MFHKHTDLTIGRLEAFNKAFRPKVYLNETYPITRMYHHKEMFPRPVPFLEATKDPSLFEPVAKVEGFELGPLWGTHWFRLEIDAFPALPDSTRHELHLFWDSGCEAMLWSADGRPLNSFTSFSEVDTRNYHVLVPSYPQLSSYAQTPLVLYVEVACNGMNGDSENWICGPSPPDDNEKFSLKKCEMRIFDKVAYQLQCDLIALYEVAKFLPNKNSQAAASALDGADRAINRIILDDPETFVAAREITAKCFETPKREFDYSPLCHQAIAVGNCHIDTAWLWPYRETRRKCGRSWVSQLRLAELYPNYRFAVSQAQQLEWVKEDYPTLYEEIKSAASQGSFVMVGGTWVEMDCNLPSGESIVRQFLYGQRLFAREFGKQCTIFWLPDTFGYSAQIPQIMKLCEIPYFLTQKLSWNQFNKFPYSTFLWEGLDGTKVLTHFPPAEIYTGNANIPEAAKCESNNQDKDKCNVSMMLYGYGDGGGGPTKLMLERIDRMGHVHALPAVRTGTPQEFFDACAKHADALHTWRGELYLELHRGTYTTQARNKLWNRRSEVLLHDIEALSSFAYVLSGRKYEYPKKELDRLWKLVLLNQFHDVIPGSSIELVYKDTNLIYKDILSSCEKLLNAAVSELRNIVKMDGSPSICAANTLEWERKAIIEVPSGNPSAEQRTEDGTKELRSVTIPGMSFGAIGLDNNGNDNDNSAFVSATYSDDKKHVILENGFLKGVFSMENATLSSLKIKQDGKECFMEFIDGVANRLVLFDDIPNYWDAWDVDIFHLEKRVAATEGEGYNSPRVSGRIAESGPLRARLEFDIELTSECIIKQTIELTQHSKRIDFRTHVKWNEIHKFLKAEFAFNVRSPSANYETQFGHLSRSTTMNTSWEMAKFEVCGHRWADLSDPNFGVAVLNDCKYGYATLGSTMRLSLLRSPKAPDAHADMGEHVFTYSLYPHRGQLQSVIREAADLNTPIVFDGSDVPKREDGVVAPHKVESLVSVSDDLMPDGNAGAVVEAVKLDEDTSSALIVRVAERLGAFFSGAVSFGFDVKSAAVVNLLEHDLEPALVSGNKVSITLRPFEIKTLKVTF